YHIDNATVIHYGQSKVQNDFYETLAKIWSGLRVYTIRDNESVSIDEVLFLVSRTANAEWAPIARSMADRLAEVFRIAYGLPSPGRASRRIFLSRSNAKIRRLTNEAELIEIARQRGFEPFVAHDGNH